MKTAIALTVLNTSFFVCLCLGMAYLVRTFPNSWYTAWLCKEESAFERKFLRVIRIASWKDKLPEWGKLLNFEKRRLSKEINLVYINQFILETCYAETGHLAMALFGFLCVIVNAHEYAKMALVLAVINFFVQLPFILIQRYNRPRLLRIKKKMENKKEGVIQNGVL